MKNLIEVKLSLKSLELLEELFKSEYRGEEPLIPIAETFDIKVLDHIIKVSSNDDVKVAELYSLKLGKLGIKYLIKDNLKTSIKTYDAISIERVKSDIVKVDGSKIEELDNFVAHAYSWITFLFNLCGEKIPFTTKYVLDKKKRKTKVKEYIIKEEFLRNKIVFPELVDFDYNNINTVPKIYTSFEMTKKLQRKHKGFELEEILVPFKEFVIFLEDGKIYHCKYKDKKLSFIEYDEGEKMLGIVIDLEKRNEKGNYSYMLDVYDNFYKYNSKEVVDPKYIASFDVVVVVLTLYFYTRFAVKKVIVKKEAPSRKNEKGSTDKYKEHSVKNQEDDYIVLPKVQRVYSYSITDTVKSGDIRKRKTPVYLKEQWQKQGYYRRTKTGKVVWVRETTCTRHKETKSKSQHIILDSSRV